MFCCIIIKKHTRLVILICVLLIVIVSMNCYYEPKIPSTSDGISCILIDTNDALPSFGNTNFVPANNSIFFHETSCKADLNSRQACGVEAAARAHPLSYIYVLFCTAVTKYVLKRGTLANLAQLDNVLFGRVHINEYSKGTPFEMLVKNELTSSSFPVEHTSDVIRFLTLFKYGGIYLDFDVITTKPLDTLPDNWIAKESSDLIATGIMRFSKDEIGRKCSETIIREINNTFHPYDWAHNGPEAVTRVFERMCTGNISNWSVTNCQGFNIFENYLFYPIHYSQSDYYFESGDFEKDDAYTHHIWNRITKTKIVRNDSRYAKLARKYCPNIYKLYGDNFGNDVLV